MTHLRQAIGGLEPVRSSVHLLGLVGTAVLLLAAVAAGLSDGTVHWPLLAILSVCFGTLWILAARQGGQFDCFEVGTVYIVIVTLYGAYPLVSYIYSGETFTPAGDARMYSLQPPSSTIATIAWYHCIYAAAFSVAYLTFRGTLPAMTFSFPRPESRYLFAIVAMFVAVKVFFAALTVAYNVKESESYGETYLAFANLPLFLRQIVGILSNSTVTLSIALLVLLMREFSKYWLYLVGWLTFEVCWAFATLGARTNLMVLLGLAIMQFHYQVRRLRPAVLVCLAASLLCLFQFMGMLRNYVTDDASPMESADFLESSGEFGAVFANAVDLHVRQEAGETADLSPINLYLVDILRLIPQQVCPIQKVDPLDWYVTTFYPEYADQGGGWCLGAVAESVLGSGWPDALWRGAVIGLAYAFIQRRFVLGKSTLWRIVGYAWLVMFAYWSFRGTSFILLGRSFYGLLVPLVALECLAALFGMSGRNAAAKDGPYAS